MAAGSPGSPAPPVSAVIDYALARRAVLFGLRAGRVGRVDVCDAQPYLVRAAKFFGAPTGEDCPVCAQGRPWQVSYAYGDALGSSAGQAHRAGTLPALAAEVGQLTVYVVEVCPDCGWNHLLRSYRLGSPAPTAARPARRNRRVARS